MSGAICARVGERACVADRAQERADAIIRIAQLEISSTTARYSRSSSRVCTGGGFPVGALLHLGAETSHRVGVGGADDAAMQAGQCDGVGAAGQPDMIGHLGDGADLRVLLLVLRHQQDARFVADVDRQRDGHAREHDGVLERDEQQVTHDRFTLHSVY